jgi:hypothetical protein
MKNALLSRLREAERIYRQIKKPEQSVSDISLIRFTPAIWIYVALRCTYTAGDRYRCTEAETLRPNLIRRVHYSVVVISLDQ